MRRRGREHRDEGEEESEGGVTGEFRRGREHRNEGEEESERVTGEFKKEREEGMGMKKKNVRKELQVSLWRRGGSIGTRQKRNGE